MLTMNLEHSRSIANLIGVLPNCCSRNSMLALLLLPQLAAWCYVEGWVICHEFPIEHGWLHSASGQIIDPTLALFDQRYVHARYFPGAAFTQADITYRYLAEQLLPAQHVTPLSYCFGWATSQHEAARVRAYANCLHAKGTACI